MKTLTNFLLAVYIFVVFAALPLSYVHVEDMPSVYCLEEKVPYSGKNFRLLLHELFFTHFNDKTEHTCNTSFSQTSGQDCKKHGSGMFLQNCLLPSSGQYLSGLPIAADCCLQVDILNPSAYYGPLSSGTSPPAC